MASTTEAPVFLCKNYAVNAIARYYAEKAGQAGIAVNMQLNLPPKMGVADSDLCIIFGNLLENGVEASLRQEDSSVRFLNANASIVSDNVVITVDNSFNGNIKKDEGVFLSSKRKGFGIGVTSVQAIAEQYHGIAYFEHSGTIFKASVILHQIKA